MAGIESTITIQSGEYRPCVVLGKKALFHRWTENSMFFEEAQRHD